MPVVAPWGVFSHGRSLDSEIIVIFGGAFRVGDIDIELICSRVLKDRHSLL
jgi:hypothetical protein